MLFPDYCQSTHIWYMSPLKSVTTVLSHRGHVWPAPVASSLNICVWAFHWYLFKASDCWSSCPQPLFFFLFFPCFSVYCFTVCLCVRKCVFTWALCHPSGMYRSLTHSCQDRQVCEWVSVYVPRLYWNTQIFSWKCWGGFPTNFHPNPDAMATSNHSMASEALTVSCLELSGSVPLSLWFVLHFAELETPRLRQWTLSCVRSCSWSRIH